MNWNLIDTAIEGCFLLDIPSFPDERGIFSETYKKSAFEKIGLPEMCQDNTVVTKTGGIRAMHWQDGEFAQAKLLQVTIGKIFDVVYDLRVDSRSFGEYVTFELNSDSPMLFVPKGCAHGFQSVSDSVVHYKTDKEYHAESQRAFLWNDPDVGIPWPIFPAIVSAKDNKAPALRDALST